MKHRFFFQSINLEVKHRFFSVNQFGSDRTISFPGNQFGSETSVWYSLVRLVAYNTDETVEILILERGLEKNSYYEKNILQPVHLWRRVCGLCWKIFVSVGSFSFLLIPSWKEGEGHPISIVLAMCFQLIEVLNWEHWRSILSNWNLGILDFRSTHFRPYWQISNCPLGNGNQVEVQAQGQMALPTVSDWYFYFTPSTRSEFSISDIVNVLQKVFLILYQDRTFWRHQSLVRMEQH